MNRFYYVLALFVGFGTVALAQDNKLESTGNVGVGTTTPDNLFEVEGNDTDFEFGNRNIQLNTHNSSWNSYPWIGFYHNGVRGAFIGSGTPQSHIDFTLENNVNLAITGGNVGIGLDNPDNILTLKTQSIGKDAFNIFNSDNSEVFELGTLSDNQTYFQINDKLGEPKMLFRTDNNKMYVLGKVGIGTTNPSSALQVGDDGTTTDGILRIASSGLANKRLQFYRAGTVDSEIFEDSNEHLNMFNYFSGKAIIFGTEGTEKLRIDSEGKVGIGTSATGNHKLAVEGSIGAREIKVEATGWSDFVFENDYELRTLEEVEQHIIQNGHLPEIPKEAEVIEKGINLGEMNAKLLQKIEELTLYLIEQNKELKSQNKQNQAQQAKIELLEKKISQLENK